MRIRTSENNHEFTNNLFSVIGAIDIGGVTMDENRNFTAVVEAVEFDDKEEENIENVFSKDKIEKECIFSELLGVPFYLVSYSKGMYSIYEVKDKGMNFELRDKLSSDYEFACWWADIKRTAQSHELNNGAQPRTDKTRFDFVIESTGQSWGGNIDGVVVDGNKILAIIDNISISFTGLDDLKADPARFFHKRGPVYNTWLSTVKLANKLKVPHILLTINKNNPKEEICGITNISNLDRSGIFYFSNITPPMNVINGKEKIVDEINKRIKNGCIPTYI